MFINPVLEVVYCGPKWWIDWSIEPYLKPYRWHCQKSVCMFCLALCLSLHLNVKFIVTAERLMFWLSAFLRVWSHYGAIGRGLMVHLSTLREAKSPVAEDWVSKWVFRGGGMVLYAIDKTTDTPKCTLCTTDWPMSPHVCSYDSLMTKNSGNI